MEGGIDCRDADQLNHAVNHDIDIAEENRHVAHRCQPQLNGRVAREGGLHSEPARNEAGDHQNRHAGGIAHMMLAAINTAAETRSCDLVENLNLMRNITAKLIARPTSDAYPAIRMSSCINPVVPTISEAAARYTPPENWTIKTNIMNRYGLSRLGMKFGTSGISKGPCGACQSPMSILHAAFHIHPVYAVFSVYA